MKEAKSCPDCGELLRRIKLLDATNPGYDSEGIQHTQLAYAAVEAEPSLFLRKVSREGLVSAVICEGCGRILLYGKTENER
jgi:hypothetical protein